MKKLKKILIMATLTTFLFGCETTRQNAMTGESETNNATIGFLTGCGIGAITGAIINKGKGAAIGCGVGGAGGLAIGYQMDKQEALLRKKLVGSGVQINRIGDKIELVLDGDITFNTASFTVSRKTYPTLESIASVMNQFEDTELLIEGHTDSVGSVSSNESLSLYRAKSIQKVLNKSGLSRSRTYVDGLGELAPICTNKTATGRACNRRVELTIM